MQKGARKFAFGEFYRDSTKKNALFFAFAAPKFGRYEENAYLCWQNNERKFIYGIGVSPIGRVVRVRGNSFYGW